MPRCALSLLCLLGLLPATRASFCSSMNEIVETDFLQNGGWKVGDIEGFHFPTGINRTFAGVVDRQCGPHHPVLNPQPHRRDPDFCLPHFPYGSSPSRECGRCEPGPENYFKFEIWRHINTINREYSHWKVWNEKTHQMEFPFGFCLTCFVKAEGVTAATPDDVRQNRFIEPHQPFLKGVNYPVPGTEDETFEGTDVQKGSVTVTTRVACGAQRDDGMFDAPTPQELADFDRRLKAAALNPKDPCNNPIFPCGEDRAQQILWSMGNMTEITNDLDSKIMEYINTEEDEEGNRKAINGHHEALMEIPNGKVHVLRANMNLNDGFKGFTYGIPDGRYTTWNDTTGKWEPYDACQAIEYGMVALSPGKVETACWLVPLITKEEKWVEYDEELGYNVEKSREIPDEEKLNQWRRKEVQKEDSVHAAYQEAQKDSAQLVLSYCIHFKGAQTRFTYMHELATSFCERHFCAPLTATIKAANAAGRQPQGVPRQYRSICEAVYADAKEYKEEAARKRNEAGGAGQGQGAWRQEGNIQGSG